MISQDVHKIPEILNRLCPDCNQQNVKHFLEKHLDNSNSVSFDIEERKHKEMTANSRVENPYINKETKCLNTKLFNLLLSACTCKELASLYPIAVISAQLTDYKLMNKLFDKSYINKLSELLIASLRRSVGGKKGIVFQESSANYKILLFNSTLSSATRTTDFFQKTMDGLTIPYPNRLIHLDVYVNTGISFFSSGEKIDSIDYFRDISRKSLRLSRISGKTEIVIG